MVFSLFGLSIVQIILIIVIVLVITFILFRRYFSALVSDFIIDPLFSFADTLIGTIPVGDLIAAVIIFKREKKIVGRWALFPALEAANFIIGLIPVAGQPIELITNWTPAALFTRLLFSKFKPAEKKERKLEKELSIAEQLGLKVSKEKQVLKDVKKLIKKSDPVDALKLIKSKKPIKEVSSKLRGYVDSLVSDTSKTIQYIVSQKVQAPQGMINILQQGINQAGQLLQQAQSAEENEDFEAAINAASNANTIIRSAAQQFDNEFRAWQNEVQQQGQLQPGYAH